MRLAVGMDVETFVVSHLDPPPARVLEVGCGSGDLARALADRGYDVTAIDPEAPVGDIFRTTSLEDFDDVGPFDAVIAVRSLHHVHDLEGGLDKIHDLLAEGGVLILDEFAWDQMDRRTADWYVSHLSEPNHHDESLIAADFPAAWIAEHDTMHDSVTLTAAVDAVFERRLFEWGPYLAEHWLKRPDLVAEEEGLIRTGDINPLGFRYVGSSKRP